LPAKEMEEIFHLFFPELGTTPFFNNSAKHVKKTL
jgi:hypothetical protein